MTSPGGLHRAPSPPDAILLAIETTGSRCSAAAAYGDAILASESRAQRHGHAETLLPMIERVMAAAGLVPAQLDAVAAAVGPGGFTGIRVGLAAAHAITLAVGARLLGVTSFAAVAARVATADRGDGKTLLVALDSRRDELYVQLFEAAGAAPLAKAAAVLPNRLAAYIAGHIADAALLIAGDATAAAATALCGRPGVTVAADTAPDAIGVSIAARRQWLQGEASVARPLYLRPPDVTLPPRLPVSGGAA